MPLIFPEPGVADPALDVVFVHGLRPLPWMRRREWRFRRGGPAGLWPKSIEAQVQGIRVGILTYDSPAFIPFGRAMGLQNTGSAVLDLLAAHGIGERPVLFVTHSLGGLLIKQVLVTSREANDKTRSVAEQCRGVVFLATPHYGAHSAAWAARLTGVWSTKATRTLLPNDESLVHLGRRYRNWVESHGTVQHLVLMEDRKTHGVMVVPNLSADPRLPDVTVGVINADHNTIAAPKNREDDVYARVKIFIEQLAQGAVDDARAKRAESAARSSRTAMADRFRGLEKEMVSLTVEQNDLDRERKAAEFHDQADVEDRIQNRQFAVDDRIVAIEHELGHIPEDIKAEARADDAKQRSNDATTRAVAHAADWDDHDWG